MPLIQVKLIEEVSTSSEKKEIATALEDAMVAIRDQNNPPWAWAEIEDVLSAEWEIGGSAISSDAIHVLVAGE